MRHICGELPSSHVSVTIWRHEACQSIWFTLQHVVDDGGEPESIDPRESPVFGPLTDPDYMLDILAEFWGELTRRSGPPLS